MKPQETIAVGAVDRWLAVVAAIAAQPGLGLDELQASLMASLGRTTAASTLYRDLALLKERGILKPGRHRLGYFLAGAGHSREETQVLLNGLRLQAEDLGNPTARQLYERLLRRYSHREQASLAMPIEAIANRPIMRQTEALADLMVHLREPIRAGQPVRARLARAPWEPRKAGRELFSYPLQLLFIDIAWYLLAEDVQRRQFHLCRLDRLQPAIAIEPETRGSEVQLERLDLARTLLASSWGPVLPAHDPEGRLSVPLIEAELRFAPEAAAFVAEGTVRHESQSIKRLGDRSLRYTVRLPHDPAVFLQFRRWVLNWGAAVTVVRPGWLRAEVAAEALALMRCYAEEP